MNALAAALARWSAAAALVSLRKAWLIPIRIKVEVRLDGVAVHLELDAPDIHTGEHQTVHHMHHAYVDQVLTEDQMLDVILRMVRSAVLHELDECLLVNGEQVNDPHGNHRWRGGHRPTHRSAAA